MSSHCHLHFCFFHSSSGCLPAVSLAGLLALQVDIQHTTPYFGHLFKPNQLAGIQRLSCCFCFHQKDTLMSTTEIFLATVQFAQKICFLWIQRKQTLRKSFIIPNLLLRQEHAYLKGSFLFRVFYEGQICALPSCNVNFFLLPGS